jgi:tetratricopeptide (TPR) repeat protein
MIQRELWIPHSGAALSAESRLVEADGQVGFDFTVLPGPSHFEVKLSPSRQEILEWLQKLGRILKTEPEVQFSLVHARGGVAVADLAEVSRVASEASDKEKFEELCSATLDQNQRAMVGRLGPEAWKIGRRIQVVQRTEQGLDDQISWMAEGLTGTGSAGVLLEMLTSRVRLASSERGSLHVAELIEDAKKMGIYLHAPLVAKVSSSAVGSAFVILQYCQDPVPLEVLASAVDAPPERLARDLEEFIQRGLVRAEGAMVSARTPPNRISNERHDELVGRALRALVVLCLDKERRKVALSQVRNIARLSEVCSSDPALVASVFPAADKLLKATGDLHLVLDVARLSIRAASRQPIPGENPSIETLRHKAQTLICGVSWVYQRIGRLPEARVYAEESLNLGQELGWVRNTAFCKKCIGRLLRLEAELSKDPDRRRTLLRESEASLREAIPIFESAEDRDLGPGCEDIGECHSLIGRTHFAAQNREAARRSIEIAYDILDQFAGSKAWADLLILDGEVNLHEGRADKALDKGSEVLRKLRGDGSELSEIRARAFLLNGRALQSLKDPAGAAEAYGNAADVYTSLGDRPNSGSARWRELITREDIKGGTIPRELRQALEAESDASVRVEAIRLHTLRLADRSGGAARSQRRGVTKAYLERLFRDARVEVRRKESLWD